MTFEQYEQEVKRHLTDKRFFHSQCVAAEAARLAQRYGADVEKARLAGILHDIMKDTPPEQQLKILRDSGIILTKTQSRNRKLWHALADHFPERIRIVGVPTHQLTMNMCIKILDRQTLHAGKEVLPDFI